MGSEVHCCPLLQRFQYHLSPTSINMSVQINIDLSSSTNSCNCFSALSQRYLLQNIKKKKIILNTYCVLMDEIYHKFYNVGIFFNKDFHSIYLHRVCRVFIQVQFEHSTLQKNCIYMIEYGRCRIR